MLRIVLEQAARVALLMVLALACAPSRVPQPPSGQPPRPAVYQPAKVPSEAGWGALPGDKLAGARPVAVSNGPLLSYRHANKLYLVDLSRSLKPQTLLEPASLNVLDRLDHDHLLVQTPALACFEMSTGRLLPLSEKRVKPISLNDDRLIYLDGEHLVCRSPHEPPRTLARRKIVAFLGEDEEALYAWTGSELYRVEKSGQGETLLGGRPAASVALSPDHTRLAMGSVAGGKGQVEVIELATSRLLARRTGLPLQLDPGSQQPPQLQLGWMDPDTVRYSVSELTRERDPEFFSDRSREQPLGYFRWRDLNLTGGQETDQGRYSRLGLRHRPPIPEALREERVIQRDELRLWLPDPNLLGGASIISQDGLWAALRLKRSLFLLDQEGTLHELAQGPVRDLVFLPAVGQVPWTPAKEAGTGRSSLFFERTLRFHEARWSREAGFRRHEEWTFRREDTNRCESPRHAKVPPQPAPARLQQALLDRRGPRDHAHLPSGGRAARVRCLPPPVRP